jgi:hypothetical protein
MPRIFRENPKSAVKFVYIIDGKRRCGARLLKKPGFCKGMGLCANGRCYRHGGFMVGGSGPHRSPELLNKGRMAYIARRKALGLPCPWATRKPEHDTTEWIDKQAQMATEIIDKVLVGFPEVAKPPEEMTHAELLFDVSRHGLLALREIIVEPTVQYDKDGNERVMDTRARRLKGEMSLGVNKIMLSVQEAQMRARTHDGIGEFLEMLRKKQQEMR